MSNKNGSLKMVLGYTGTGGESAKQDMVVSFVFNAQTHGTVDVPNEATGDFEIPFGSVETAASMVVIRNRTGQSCKVAVNGQTDGDKDLGDGGVLMLGGAVPTENPITGVTLTLSAAQEGAGLIEYHVFGDPT